jgi:CDP-paratose 2-epimerase
MSRHFLITGGAGFIGSNYVTRLLQRGEKVTIYDNLSRAGAPINIQWLYDNFGNDSFDLIIGDVRDISMVNKAVEKADVIVHLAAQVAVTTSVLDPREDFEINAMGTFNVLEAGRRSGRKPLFLYASTNKVYGGMEGERVAEGDTNYYYEDLPLGVPETQNLDFHSPYGCSKGCGDQYVRDYARIYSLPTVVFRQSCIYGQRQFGVEDQGWVAWFVIAALTGKPITIYGDGKQVRDVLFVDDLLDIYDLSIEKIEISAGNVYNIGGGPENTMSIWKEFGPKLQRLTGEGIPITRGPWRPGDQRIYVSDIQRVRQELGWSPKISVDAGLERIFNWAKENRQLFDKVEAG